MTVPFMRAYTELLVRTCHRRGAHAIGGMAAFIPSRRDPEVNDAAMARVRDDKERESSDGFDGTWVAHPDLVPARDRDLRRRPGRPRRTRRRGCGRRSSVGGRRAARPARRRRRGHRGRRAAERLGRAPVPRLVAARQRRRRDQQPDGGRGDRRDLPLAALAVARDPDPPRPTAGSFDGDLLRTIRDEELAHARRTPEPAASRTPCRAARPAGPRRRLRRLPDPRGVPRSWTESTPRLRGRTTGSPCRAR